MASTALRCTLLCGIVVAFGACQKATTGTGTNATEPVAPRASEDVSKETSDALVRVALTADAQGRLRPRDGLHSSVGLEDLDPQVVRRLEITIHLLPAPVDLTPLARFSKLTHLRLIVAADDLSGPELRLTPIAQLRQLEEFRLEYQGINPRSAPLDFDSRLQLVDLAALARSGSVRHLQLWHTAIAEIGPLLGMTQLVGLSLFGTTLPDGAEDQLREALPSCEISEGMYGWWHNES
jgi:hypothetical protein